MPAYNKRSENYDLRRKKSVISSVEITLSMVCFTVCLFVSLFVCLSVCLLNKGQSSLAIGGCELEVPTPNLPPSVGGPGSLPSTTLFGTTGMSQLNGISFHPTALAGCTSVTDDTYRHTYIQTERQRAVTSLAIGEIEASEIFTNGEAKIFGGV